MIGTRRGAANVERHGDLVCLSKITMEGPSNQAGAAAEARQKSTRDCHECDSYRGIPARGNMK
jgi:hypothetical protein